MSNAMRNRLTRLERTLGASEDMPAADLPMLSAEQLDAALAVAAPFADDGAGAYVETIRAWVSPESAEAVEHARALLQAAFRLGWARLGYQADAGRYLDAALTEMLPEPRSREASEMVSLFQSGSLPLIRYIVVPAVDGRPAPEGWRPA